MPLWTKYNERVRILQGWEVPLHCPHCGCDTVPRSESNGIDTKAVHKNPDDLPLLLSTMTCTECRPRSQGSGVRETDGTLRGRSQETWAAEPRNGVVVCSALRGRRNRMGGCISRMVDRLRNLVVRWSGCLWPRLPDRPLSHSPQNVLVRVRQSPLPAHGGVGRSYCFRCSSCSRLRRRG